MALNHAHADRAASRLARFAPALAAGLALVAATPVRAQFQPPPGRRIAAVGYIGGLTGFDVTGTWGQRLFEDWVDRMPGPDYGDYTGIPLNEAGRMRADTWDVFSWSLPEWQCRPHGADYRFRSDWPIRTSKETDPVSRELVAYRVEAFGSTDRWIYMDGRPHPSQDAQHTWAGFSTGRWEGGILTVDTTHIKENYLRRNGVPVSDRATMTEHWIRNGDVLTVTTITTDPVYLTEPFIRTTDYELDLTLLIPPFRCEVGEESSRPKGDVPHHLPGANPFLKEFADRFNLPFEVTRGGAETMYPDYQTKLAGVSAKTSAAKPDTRFAQLAGLSNQAQGEAARVPAPPARIGASGPVGGRTMAAVDVTGDWVSVVTEDWRWRMVAAPKGDVSGVPLTPEGVKLANEWNPARDEAAGEQCRAYGAAGLMRMPGRLRINWENDTALRIDTEAGTQTRLIRMGAVDVGAPAWQGYSAGEWVYVSPPAPVRGSGGPAPQVAPQPPPGPAGGGGALKATTSGLRTGYLRRNGVPYSSGALLTEYFNRVAAANGDQYLIITTIVDDPAYLRQRFITSTHFKRIPTGSAWRPTPCGSM